MEENGKLLFWERAVVDINNGECEKRPTPLSAFEAERKCLFCDRRLSRRFGVAEYFGSVADTPESERWSACADCIERKTFFRADGDAVCKICGREYRAHPEASKGLPFLTVLCGGQLVKL